ncbi:MAG: HAD family phosphatase [Euryarchaeota archaeon]|nr:HAD family phosphatase [Euryarchaeota archaeon]
MDLCKKKVFIFDMDGVLIDSNKIKARSFAFALRRFGVNIKEEEILKYMGMSRWEIAKAIIRDYNLKISVEELVKVRMEILEDLRKNIKPFPCVKDLLNLLKSLGKTLVLATSSDRASVLRELRDLLDIFDKVVTSDEVSKSKPDPEIYIKASQDFKKELCVVIEDSPHGILAAKRAGLYCIAVANGYRDPSTLMKAGADLVLEDICSLYWEIVRRCSQVDTDI